MPRVIQVRLKNKTMDEYVDVSPHAEERPPWRVEVDRHRIEQHDDGSLAVIRERILLSGGYSTYREQYRHVDLLGETVVGHYGPGEYTSFRETEREDEVGPPEAE